MRTVITLFFLFLCGTGVAAGKGAYRFRIPVLCYHSITDRDTGRFTISTGVFEQQMQYLYMNGYTVLSLDRLVSFLKLVQSGKAKRIRLPRKPVVITFDDNYATIPLNALPILRMYGFRATNFVYTLFMTPKRWAWLSRFAAQGLDFGSHTCNHVDLARRRPGEDIRAYRKRIFPEMRDSRRIIAEGLKRPVKYLAYPFGTSNPEVRYLARLAGYSAMFSALGGYVTEKSSLDNIPRFTMFRDFSLEMFKLIVSGGWNRGLEKFIQDPKEFKIREYNFDFGE